MVEGHEVGGAAGAGGVSGGLAQEAKGAAEGIKETVMRTADAAAATGTEEDVDMTGHM